MSGYLLPSNPTASRRGHVCAVCGLEFKVGRHQAGLATWAGPGMTHHYCSRACLARRWEVLHGRVPYEGPLNRRLQTWR